MNHKPTQREIAYAEEIWHTALNDESLSSYTDQELDRALYLIVEHSTHLNDASNDTDALVKVNRAIKAEINHRHLKIDTKSKVKWSIIGAVIGLIISQVFNSFFHDC